jgi:hypothetical protein
LVRLNTFANAIEAEDKSSSSLDMELIKMGNFLNSSLVSILFLFMIAKNYIQFYKSNGLLKPAFDFS